MITDGLVMVIPRIFRLAIDTLMLYDVPGSSSFFSKADLSLLANATAAIIALVILAGLFRVLSRVTLFNTGRNVEYDLRNDLFHKLTTLEPAYFQGTRTGDIMSRLTNDLGNVRMLVGPGILNIINTCILYVLVLSQMLSLSPSLTLYAFLPIPIFILIVRRMARQIHTRSLETQAALGDMSTQLHEHLSGIQVVKAFVREEYKEQEFERYNKRYYDASIGLARIRAAIGGVMIAFGGIGSIIVLWLGGREVISGEITLGVLLAFTLYLIFLAWPTMALGWILAIFQRGAASMQRIAEILDREPTIRDAPGKSLKKIDIKGEIEFRDFSFAYREARNSSGPGRLSNISAKVKPGQTCAILGPTGAGKSTMVSAIARLVDVPEGCLFIDGVDINNIPLANLRDAVAMVPQDTFLFSNTLSANIAFSKPDATKEEILKAARIAQIDKDIKDFPEGYDTVIGERGIRLSGGQRQRIALARALLKNPSILILDDALSSVDTETEKEILTGLKAFMHERTSIIISMRISAVKDADLIFVLDEGRLVETGTHEQLFRAGGLYWTIYQRQLIVEEISKM